MSIIIKMLLLILYILLFLIVVLLLISIVPFSYSIVLEIYNSDMDGNVSIKWLNGFLGIQFHFKEKKYYMFNLFGKTLFTHTIDEKSETFETNKIKPKNIKENKKTKMEAEENRSKTKNKLPVKYIEFKELIRIFKTTLSKLFKKLKPDKFKIYGIYGFQDPALTGMFSGIISIINGFKETSINLYPTFLAEVIDANIEITGKFRIIDLIIIFFSTILKTPIRKLIFNKRQ